MKVRWSDRAIADLTEIRDFIAEDSERHATALMERLITAAENLEIFPDRGRRVPDVPELPDLRELLVSNYRILYRRKSEQLVEVVLVIDGRRDLSRLDSKSWQP